MPTYLTNDADAYFSQDGDDEVFGLGGDDFIATGAGDDTIHGGSDDDTMIGSAGADHLDGGSGIDTASYFYASQGIFAYLDKGEIKVDAEDTDQATSIENINGSFHRDVVVGTGAANVFHGLAGDDSLHGEGGADRLYGGDGRDGFYGGTGADQMHGGDGVDKVSYVLASSAVTVSLLSGVGSQGEAAGDVLTSIEEAEGSHFDDTITGTSGDNLLLGRSGADELYGLAGKDVIYGEEGEDTISGGANDDTMLGGTGADDYDGGSGIDSVIFSYSTAAIDIDLQDGTGKGGEAEGDSYVSVEHVFGTSLDDVMRGSGADNRIVGNGGDDLQAGGGGADLLQGTFGADTISGNAGADTVVGGADRDILRGQGGEDDFVFELVTDSGLAPQDMDIVKDFVAGQDVIDLSGIDANGAGAGNGAFDFIGNAGFGGAAGELRFFKAGQKTFLEGDVSGDGAADFQIRFDSSLDFTAGDFVL